MVPYFPQGFETYTKFYICMKSPHEQQVIDLLSSLTCQSAFFKVGDHLMAYAGIDMHAGKVLFDIMSKMLSTGLVSTLVYSVPIIYYSQ